jgi:DNA-binding HxlR family transcriptional regulator
MRARARKSECPIHAGLAVFGDAWTLLVIRDLFRGRNTFTELLSAKEGIATNVLADRLARLEAEGIVTKESLPGRGNPTRYELTEKGLELLPILVAIGDWSLKHDEHTSATRELARRRKREVAQLTAEIRARLRGKKWRES